MSEMSNIWNWNRFAQLIGLKLKLEKWVIGRQLIVIFAATLVIFLLSAPGSDASDMDVVARLSLCGFIAFMGFLCVLIVCIQYASRAFSAFKNRESGWVPVLLPASQLEKYVSNCVVSTILVPAAYLITYIIPILIVILTHDKVSLDIFNENFYAIPDIVRSELSEHSQIFTLYAVNAVLYWFSGNVMFFMSSVIWPKHPILLGFIVSFVFGTIGQLLMSSYLYNVSVNTMNAMDMAPALDSFVLAAWASIITQIVFTLILLGVGWAVYRRRTVV